MTDDVQELHRRLQAYLHHDDPTALANRETAIILERVEWPLRGREPDAAVGLVTLLAQVHLARYQVLDAGEDQPDLLAAVRWYRLLLPDYPDRVPDELRELILGGAFGPNEPDLGDPDLLSDAAVESGIVQLESLSMDGSPRWRVALAAFLTTAHERTGRTEDLDRAIELARSVISDGAASPAELHAARGNLAAALLNQFVRFSDRGALGESIDLYCQQVIERGRAADHANLGAAHLTRFEITADPADLEIAIKHAREAVRLTPESDTSYAPRLSNLAGALRAQFDETGDDSQLNEAVMLAELAVRVTPLEEPERARRLSNLCAALSTRFEVHGTSADVDRAIEAGYASLSPELSSGAPGRASNLLLALHLRGAATGSVNDLQEALALGRTTAAALPRGHADRPDILSNTAGAAMTWFDWTGDIAAISGAVDLSREAVDAGESGRGGLMHTNLSMHLLTCYEVTGDPTDIDEAVRHAEIGAAAADGPAASIAQSNLALALRTRHEITGAAADLERAIVAARTAIERSAAQHRDHAAIQSNLALCLWQAGDETEALQHARAALEDPMIQGTPSRAAYAANVARMLTALEGDPDEIMALWRQVGPDVSAPVPLRLEAYLMLAESPQEQSLARADDLSQAVGLIPAAAWHGLGVPSRLRRLREWQGVGQDAAAAALGFAGPERALGLLDTALSQLWAREVLSTGEEERLGRIRPDLARRIEQLREARSR